MMLKKLSFEGWLNSSKVAQIQYVLWTLSTITSQHKNGGNSGGTLYRVVLGEMITFIYCSKGEGEVFILT